MSQNISHLLIDEVKTIAYDAGKIVKDIFAHNSIETSTKPDHTPVTNADIQANQYIVEHLQKLTPTINIVSEESIKIFENERLEQRDIWLVDPLDGTKEFIQKLPFFTINIAYVHDGFPILGVVYAPMFDALYFGSSEGAYLTKNGVTKPIKPYSGTRKPIVAVSHSHMNQETKTFLKSLGEYEEISIGSSLKICYVADGTADYYPRFVPCMEWDTAAADGVLRAAGGMMQDAHTNKPLIYNKKDLHNPYFIALGKK